ncbi:MAG TPA: hypothetical protein VFH42_00280, partial [Sporolactobacillaceae bacterium]|nr:hypothetical protein [Sporolactobacillaceae bacterium]
KSSPHYTLKWGPRMNFTEKRAALAKKDENILLADGFEDALIGVLERFEDVPLAVYDRDKCIKILMERDGMTDTEADEFFYFNCESAYVGEYTPLFIIVERF